MKTRLIKSLTLALSVAGVASADPINFIYEGDNYGVMNISYVDGGTIQVSMAAAAGGIASTTAFQITGFGFDFTDSFLAPGGLSVSNSAGGDPALNWYVTDKDFPNATNSGVVKGDITFAVDEITKPNYTTPGIMMGNSDIFTISGFQGLTAGTDLHSVVLIQGIRIQGIEYAAGYSGEGSLFLTGSNAPAAVPEPSTVALMGLGLLGLVAASRRRNK